MCEHLFHGSCIITWFKKNPVCPICKIDLNKKELIKYNKNNDIIDPVIRNENDHEIRGGESRVRRRNRYFERNRGRARIGSLAYDLGGGVGVGMGIGIVFL